MLGDKVLLVLVALASCTVIGGVSWVFNRSPLFAGHGHKVTIASLMAYCIFSMVRFDQLKKKLAKLGVEEPPFFPRGSSSPPR